MHIFPRALQIGDTEGFTVEKDIFGRQELGSGLTNLVGSVADPMVIAIDGQWGTGKTTFLKMWAGAKDWTADKFIRLVAMTPAAARHLNTPTLKPSGFG